MNSVLARDREHIVAMTGSLWEGVRGKTVFVTGGTGFVGSWLVEAFVAANAAYNLNATLLLLTRDKARFFQRAPHLRDELSLRFVESDIRSFDLPGERIDFVIHAATERWFAPTSEEPLGIVGPDLIATKRVLDLTVKKNVARVLFTSSGAVYGPTTTPSIPESYANAPDPTTEAALYGESKRMSELAFTSYARVFGFEAVIARLFAFVGPLLPLDEGYAVGNFVADALHERTIQIAGDGSPRRSYLYAADLAIWLWTMLLARGSGVVYNVGSPHATSIRELANTVAKTTGVSDVCIAKQPGSGPPASYVPDTTRAQTDFGLDAWVSLDEAIARTYSYHKESWRTVPAP